MTETEPAYLFVYGTLMTRAHGRLGADMRTRLRLEGTSLGAATTAGRLVALGDYPGLVEAAGPRDVVHGELFRLERPDDVLAWLDAYEGVSVEPNPDDEYVRVRAPVRRTSGVEVTAWIYVYRGGHAHAGPIAGGQWGG
jgi:gamma-glutamylcyclotransferase (GGCT)/AIG2-like uncharacterized protein YtfP